MAVNPSNAGPFRFRNAALAQGATEIFDTRREEAGPGDKRGGLTKYYGERGGFDYVKVINNSDEIVAAETNGGVEDDVPPNSSVTVSGMGPDGTPTSESTAYTFCNITHTDVLTTAQIDADLVTVLFGNGPRPEAGSEFAGVSFDPRTLIPGVVRNG